MNQNSIIKELMDGKNIALSSEELISLIPNDANYRYTIDSSTNTIATKVLGCPIIYVGFGKYLILHHCEHCGSANHKISENGRYCGNCSAPLTDWIYSG